MPAQRSCKIRIILWVGGIFLPAAFLCKSSAALDPGRQINQYGHAAWRLQDGVLGSMPTAITQTTDGYLWIGTKTGLVRFDGMRFVPWALPGQHLPSDSIYSLQAAADNSLWIGTGAGLAHWKNGLLTNYPDAPGLIDSIIEDHRRAIWFTRSRVRDTKGPLCQALETNARCYGQPDGIPFPYAGPLAEDQQRNLWIGSTTALMRWMPGSFSSYAPNGLKPAEGLSGVNALAPASDGSLWVGIGRQGPGLGLQQLSQGVWKPFATSELDGSSLEVTALFLDSENSLWVGTSRQGIYRIHNRKVDHFRSTDGLSGDQIFSFYQDREGVLWVVTSKGIDSFRDLRVVTFSTAQGLSADNVGSVLASREGAVWISNHPGLDVLRNGTVSSISPAKGLPGERVTSLLEDHAGLLWVGVDNGLFVYDQEKFSKVVKPDGAPIGVIVAITEEVTGDIWAETVGRSQALVHIHNRRVSEEITTAQIPRARALASDPQGGIWLGLLNDGLGHYRQGRFETFRYSPGAAVRDVIIDPDGSVLGATETGLIAWRNGSQRTLTTQNGLPCNQIYTLISDTFGSLWLYAECGLIEISREQLKGWWDKPETTVNVRVFDVFDGADPSSSSFRPSASRSQDGMLWFANENVLQMIDPAHLAMNTLPPPVHVENIIADRKSYSLKQDLRLPPLTRDLEIDYTALSFVVPQKVRFRYKLDGWDADWQSAGTRRQAFYTNLGPRRYSFRVMACNNDGVWNESGASVDFLIVPAFYQTPWFAVAASLSIVCLLSLIYLVRLGQVTSQVRARLYARLSERERIARDLHDTFFQGIQGLLLRFHTATMQMRKDEPARPIFEAALKESDQVMLDGRELVLDLHTSTTDSYELPSALVAAGNEFKTAYPTAFKILVNGDPQPLHPIVSEESYKIGREALYNAFRHAGAHTIEAELNYEPNELRLRIRDDGAGIDPNVLKDGFRKGHWGLPGMRERASKIGAHFAVWSRLNSGTEVELRVRAAVAYRSMPKSLWRRWLPGAVARNEQSYD
jgi:signal transduction histidine kinase/ligand-binding sensor domain-containing protein